LLFLVAHNGAELCEEVVFGIQLFQKPMPLISDLMLNLAQKPLFYKAHVVRSLINNRLYSED
jgi:hypothetical protein